MRIFAANKALVLVVAVAAAPRLAVLLHERGAILTSFVEKSDTFARTFVDTGTYGFVPGVPSAYTQPLYGWFLIPLYAVDRTWIVVGLAQIALACLTAALVFTVGRRLLGVRAAVVAAVLATLNPYLIWHDVHVNREILDQLLAALLLLLALIAAERGGWAIGLALGAAGGLAILGNSRLAALPLALAAYVLVRRRDRAGALAAAAVVVGAVVVLAPWAIRNRVQVGCFAITTDARALWKANNTNTYGVLARGGWIDDVPPLAGAPKLTPEYEVPYWQDHHRIVRVPECPQMHLYERETLAFWRHHPGEKLKLMGQATRMLWQPEQTRTEGGPSSGGRLRSWIEVGWALPMYALALLGLFVLPRALTAPALVFLGYETLEAWVFAGATRYRVPFDFVLALLAGGAIVRVSSSSRYTASTPSAAAATEN